MGVSVDFTGRNIVLKGVGREGQVGEAVANAFAEAGARVLLIDRVAGEARARADALKSKAWDPKAFAADLADVDSVNSLLAQIREACDGAIHALVHLAGGFGSSGPVAESDPAVWIRQMTINATTAYLTARAFIPLLRPTRGSAVFFASEAVLPGARTAGVSAYAASKSAVVSLVHSIAQEEEKNGVRANAVAPTSIRTASNVASMGADAAYVSREEVANVVLWLCSDEARVVNGQIIRVR